MAMETESLELDPLVLEAGIRAVFDDPAKGHYYVAETDGVVVASLMLTFEWSDWRNGNVWWIQSVYMEKAYRNRGIFRQMYEYLRQFVLQDPAIRGLRLYVDERNRNAQAVYRAIGMNGDHYRVFEWMK
jgi:GNAT superfamily N-acetyltransferase